MKVKFYDQKLKLGRKLFGCCRALDVSGSHEALFIFVASQRQPALQVLAAFWGCSFQAGAGVGGGIMCHAPCSATVTFQQEEIPLLFQKRTEMHFIAGIVVLGVQPGSVQRCEQSICAGVRAGPPLSPPV